jgi:hypothetical protein
LIPSSFVIPIAAALLVAASSTRCLPASCATFSPYWSGGLLFGGFALISGEPRGTQSSFIVFSALVICVPDRHPLGDFSRFF